MDYYLNIKDHLIRNEINHRIKDYSKNKSDLDTYYEVGKLLVLAQGGEKRAKYGNGLIKEYSNRLTNELGKHYTITYLKRMRQFYLIIEKGAPLVHQLTWSHYIMLISLKDIAKITYYINICGSLNLSKRQLKEHIKHGDYERLDETTKLKLLESKETDIIETIKNPIIISNPNNIEVYKEITLQKLILENYSEFLKELGSGYSLIDNEYKIKIGNRYYFIDLLLYNYKYKCFVVIELKIGELKKEHIGQITLYMNYVDNNLKETSDNKTIGIILCHKDNKLIMEYCSNKDIITREYVII